MSDNKLTLELVLKFSMICRPEFKRLNSPPRDHLIYMTNRLTAAKLYDSVMRQFVETFPMISVFLDLNK